MRAFDIETIADKAKIPYLPEPEVKYGNTKDPEKIKGMIFEAKQNQIEKMGLNPETGRICSFSFYGDNQEDRFFKVIPEISDAAEIELINEVLDSFVIEQQMISREESKIITWNGMRFDFPYIYKRAALLRIPLPAGCPGLKYWTRKYTSEVHCDLMQELCNWDISQKAKLDNTGKLYLGRGKTSRDYQTYIELIESGQGDLIGLDCLCDTNLTYDLYQLLSTYLF